MKTKQIYLTLIIMEFSFCIMCKAENEAHLLQTNSDWHITSGSLSTAPFWLVPSGVPVRFYPLKNGQWVWTTNMDAMLDDSIIDSRIVEFDEAKRIQVERQEKQRMYDTAPPGIVHVAEYGNGHFWNTNMTQNWWGIWVEDTNTGWRVNLCPVRSNAIDTAVIIKVGSIVTNSGAGLMGTPDGKYAKLELLDANGKAVSTRRGAAAKLYAEKNAVMAEAVIEHVNNHPPSADDASVERGYPDTISDLEYSRWKKGSFLHYAGFVSNGPPCHIGFIKFNDIFSIKSEDDYTLTVQPVLYRMHCDGGTFQGYLDRVDLPSITTKVHLVPNAK